MAFRRRKKRDRNFVVIPFSAAVGLGALVQDTATSAGIMTLGEDLYVISIDATWSIDNPDDADGPIDVGFAHGDLTDTEIAEARDASLTDPDDIIAKERARRPTRLAGTFRQVITGGVTAGDTLNDGKPIRTRMGISVGDGHTIDFWAIVRGANLVTGSTLRLAGDIYGRWQR